MKKRMLTNLDEMEGIINKCEVCYLGMVDDQNEPYVIPFNFGFHDHNLFLHSAPEGKKIDVLKKNNKVCVAFSTDHKLAFQSENVACSYGMKFRSVLLKGHVEFITDYETKIQIMNFIMQKYTGRNFSYSKPAIENVLVMKVVPNSVSGKEYGY